MRSRSDFGIFLLLLSAVALCLLGSTARAAASQEDSPAFDLVITGHVSSGQTVDPEGAEVRVQVPAGAGRTEPDLEVQAITDAAGNWLAVLHLPAGGDSPAKLMVEVSKPGHRTERQELLLEDMLCSSDGCHLRAPDLVLSRDFNAAFIIATVVFAAVFGLISFNVLHETIAAFLGAAVMLGVSYFVGSSNPIFWIIGFDRAIEYIDFDVIFLLMTMMIFMAIMSQTGVFQWLAYQTFRLARGHAFVVAAVLVVITGLISSVLNDTTVMLLMAPVSIQIALALRIHPAAIIVPEILASNIGGSATLIGTPPNTIIGSYVGLGFTEFLVNMLPMAVIGMVVLLFMTRWLYGREFERSRGPGSEALAARLEEGSRISDTKLLRKSLIVFGLTLILFFVGDFFHMPPAVTAILGSTALLLWVRPDVGQMLREVDWTTLVFFMSLFMMVGGIREVGLIQLVADGVQALAGQNLLLATLLVIWVSTIASAIVANIPFAAAMAPVTLFLTMSLTGGEGNVLYWGLALGAGFGGNATYIGSAPNIVAAGIMDRAGYRLRFMDFSRVGVPVTFATVLACTVWVLIRYFWLGF